MSHLAFHIYGKVNKDIKELENKNLNEYEVLDFIINNESRYASQEQVDKIHKDDLERGLKEVLQAFWADPKFPEFLGFFKIPLEFLTEVKHILDQFLQETTEKPKPYPYPLKKVFPLRAVAKAEKARAQFPALIKQYETIQGDPEKVAEWLKTLRPGQRAAMQDYIEYAERAAQEATENLQISLTSLSINLTALSKALAA